MAQNAGHPTSRPGPPKASACAGSKPEFELRVEGPPGTGLREDDPEALGDLAEDFGDHGGGILAGLVGQLRGVRNFFTRFRLDCGSE